MGHLGPTIPNLDYLTRIPHDIKYYNHYNYLKYSLAFLAQSLLPQN